MSPRRLRDLREELTAEQQRLEVEIASLTDPKLATPPDVVEQAELAIEASSIAQRRQRAQTRLDEVQAALDRFEDGTIGTCATCGDSIDDERLELLPTTTSCRRDAGLRVAS